MGYLKTILDLLLAIFSAVPTIIKYFTKTPQEKVDKIEEGREREEKSDEEKGKEMGDTGRDPGV
jgi:hypothetical protein